MRIALDAMGGDHAPREIVLGAVQAYNEFGLNVILVGREDLIQKELANYPATMPGLTVYHCSQTIAMEEHPAEAVRQKANSSIVVGLDLVKRGEAAAFVSAGNSGAVMAAAVFNLGRVHGIERPAIGTVFQTLEGPCLLLDAGATVDCKPSYLLQFAHMGSSYMKRVYGVDAPRVAILSNGAEEGKGNQLVKEAHVLIKTSDLNFIGNLEGQDLFRGAADVVVADGFTGNIALKVAEGVGHAVMGSLRDAVQARLSYKLGAWLLKPALKLLVQKLDYAEHGGAPLLGVNGIVMIAHGRSNAKAIKNALRAAKRCAEEDIVAAMQGAPTPAAR